jgi:hypothetical protein
MRVVGMKRMGCSGGGGEDDVESTDHLSPAP